MTSQKVLCGIFSIDKIIMIFRGKTINSTGRSLSLEEVERFEKNNGIHLPDEYKLFLSTTNGGCPDDTFFQNRGWKT